MESYYINELHTSNFMRLVGYIENQKNGFSKRWSVVSMYPKSYLWWNVQKMCEKVNTPNLEQTSTCTKETWYMYLALPDSQGRKLGWIASYLAGKRICLQIYDAYLHRRASFLPRFHAHTLLRPWLSAEPGTCIMSLWYMYWGWW